MTFSHRYEHWTSASVGVSSLLCILATMIGCGHGHQDDSSVLGADEDQQSITNGREAAKGQFPSVLLAKLGNSWCTASRVGPSQILTAAHCVESDNFGVGLLLPLSDGLRGDVYGYFHMASSTTARPFDVAVITVQETLPDAIPILAIDPEKVQGEELTLVGYGCSSRSRTSEGAGRLRYGSSWASGVSDTAIVFPGGAGLCPGDSGGPVLRYRNGKPYAVGVNSSYWRDSGRSNAARLDLLADWLRARGASVGVPESPTPVPDVADATFGKVVKVAAGTFHACALDEAGAIKCWGAMDTGALGTGDALERGTGAAPMGRALPTVKLGSRGKAVDLVAGQRHSCALFESGRVTCWGSNDNGELGIGAAGPSVGTRPSELGDALQDVALPAGTRATGIAAGAQATCATLDTGFVACWGRNESGQLGLGDTNPRHTPVIGHLQSVKRIAKVSISGTRLCALRMDGTVDCWGAPGQRGVGLGYGSNDSVGDEPIDVTGSPRAIDLGGRRAVDIHAGDLFACALTDSNEVLCWGRTSRSRLGRTYAVDEEGIGDQPGEMGSVLRALDRPSSKRIAGFVSSGTLRTCVVFTDQTLGCWGNGESGALLPGSTEDHKLVDINPGGEETVTSAGTGDWFTCASFSNGRVKCWGRVNSGAVGTTAFGDVVGDTPAETINAIPYVDLGQ